MGVIVIGLIEYTWIKVILPPTFLAIWTAFPKAQIDGSESSKGTKIFSNNDADLHLAKHYFFTSTYISASSYSFMLVQFLERTADAISVALSGCCSDPIWEDTLKNKRGDCLDEKNGSGVFSADGFSFCRVRWEPRR